MCTATWWRDGEDYTLFFNRDELKTRSRAEPPVLLKSDGNVAFLSPIDPDGGGTWMLTNEYGVTICLLNLWHHNANTLPASVSRGKVVLSLADSKDVGAVREAIQALDTEGTLKGARPFTLLALDKGGEVLLKWNAEELIEKEIQQPLTSSSFDFENVAAARRDAYASLENHDGCLAAYHQGGEENSAYTVRMCRPDAQTWSISRVDVRKDMTLWEYQEELPELASRPPLHSVELQRC